MDPYLSEIRVLTCNFAPVGWALCQGQILPISQYTALFSLLGTNYGGNGTSNFALPNMQGNMGMGMGQGPGLTDRFIGETDGSTTVTVLQTEMPLHSHTVQAGAAATTNLPAGNSYASEGRGKPPAYVNPTVSPAPVTMNPTTVGVTGGSQPHNNMNPYLALNFCICMSGVFPARN
jgi:microcystin-dependent protein